MWLLGFVYGERDVRSAFSWVKQTSSLGSNVKERLSTVKLHSTVVFFPLDGFPRVCLTRMGSNTCVRWIKLCFLGLKTLLRESSNSHMCARSAPGRREGRGLARGVAWEVKSAWLTRLSSYVDMHSLLSASNKQNIHMYDWSTKPVIRVDLLANEIYTCWINNLSMDVWFVMIGQYLVENLESEGATKIKILRKSSLKLSKWSP